MLPQHQSNSQTDSTGDDPIDELLSAMANRAMMELGWTSLDEVDDLAPDYLEKQAKRRSAIKSRVATRSAAAYPFKLPDEIWSAFGLGPIHEPSCYEASFPRPHSSISRIPDELNDDALRVTKWILGEEIWNGMAAGEERGGGILRALIETYCDPARTEESRELLIVIGRIATPALLAVLDDGLQAFYSMFGQTHSTDTLPHIRGIETLRDELKRRQAEAARWRISDEKAVALVTLNEALSEAFVKNPEIKSNDDLRIDLDNTVWCLADQVTKMPPEFRRGFLDGVIADWLLRNGLDRVSPD